MTKRGCAHFTSEIYAAINRMRQEYDMTYAEIIGCMQVITTDIILEAFDGLEEEEEPNF